MVGRPDCSTWSRAEARRRSPNGSPSARSRSARRWRRSRWMRSRATRRPPHVRCRMPWRSSTRSTSSSSPATRSRPCAAGSNARPPAGAAPGPIRSIGAGGSCSRPQSQDRQTEETRRRAAWRPVQQAARPRARRLPEDHRLLRAGGPWEGTGHDGRAHRIPRCQGIAPGCPGLVTLGRTLKRRMADILAFFDHPNGANRPTEAINGRLETLRGHSPRLPQPRQLHH